MITPMNGRVAVEATPDEKYEGIVMPEGIQLEKTDCGVIVAVSEEVESTFVGKKIFFNKWAADEVTHEEKKYLLILEEDILAIL